MSGALALAAAAAAACFTAALALGALVARRPPTAVDAAGARLRGEGVALALFFTGLGRWYAVTAVALLAFAIAVATHHGVTVVATIVAAQLAAQAAVEALKLVFDRPRPDDWLRIRELGRSYPSGHTVTTIVFYGSLLVAAGASPLPHVAVVASSLALGACLIGIPWSRLALGAHYLTDVAGGLLVGAGWLCALIALVYRFNAA